MKTLSLPKIDTRIFFLLLGWALFLSFEFWGYGAFSYVKIPDSADANLSARIAVVANSESNETGNWNADLWGGTDRNAQSDSLGIFDGLFYIMPGWLANGLFMFLQRGIAGCFMYLLLRKHLKLEFIPALLPSLLYAAYPQPQINLQFEGFTLYDGLGLPALPMYLYFLGELATLRKAPRLRHIALAFLLGLFFANVSQYKYTFFTIPIIFGWLLLVYPGREKISLWPVIAFGLGWFTLEIFEIGAAFTISSISQRTLRSSCYGVTAIETFSARQFIDKYVVSFEHIPGLLLGILGIILGKKNRGYQQGILFGSFLVAYFAFSFYLPEAICSDLNPFGHFKGFNYARFYICFPFLICLFYGTGLNSILHWSQTFSKKKAISLTMTTLVALLFLVPLYSSFQVKRHTLTDRLNGSNFANVYLNPYLLRLSNYSKQLGGRYRSVTVAIDEYATNPSSAFLWTYGLNTIDGYSALFTLRYLNYWLSVISPMTEEIPECRYYLKLLQGNSRIWLSTMCDTGEILHVEDDLSDWFNIDLLSLTGTRFFVTTFEINDPRLTEINMDEIKCAIPGCTRYFVYESLDAMPYAFTLDQVFIKPNEDLLLEALSEANISQLKTVAFLNSQDLVIPMDAVGQSEAEIHLATYSSDRFDIQYESSSSKILIVNSTYYPGWKVLIDGEKVPTFPVDYVLMGIFVPEGSHKIEFRYEPLYTWEGFKDFLSASFEKNVWSLP